VVYLAELAVCITVWSKSVRIFPQSVPHVHRHKQLDDDATENVKLNLPLHVFCGIVAFAASREYVSVQD